MIAAACCREIAQTVESFWRSFFSKASEDAVFWKKAAPKDFYYFYQRIIVNPVIAGLEPCRQCGSPWQGGPCFLPTAGISGQSLVDVVVVR
ncbi:hypothetical protein [Komagataeibacter diospyri]|uniref:hypothetical protein n=1 Tax=Komagataeibacter diospyri TaxID=1932662 RepID=UPI0011446C29|nr:hypothetical protein [Komagataeibacter diospyri]